MNRSGILNTYAAYSKNEEVRLQSSSGAVFSLFAEYIISKNGAVYGVAMSGDCRTAEFIRTTERKDIEKLRSSKYLQAKVKDAYKNVKNDLEDGIVVLFTGTGCQINGLKTFLDRGYENLYCVDVLCHGVPSPALWRKYVEYIERKNNAQLVAVNFRCKDISWSDFGMKKVVGDHEEIYISRSKDPYMQMFLRNYCLRPSCYECTAKTYKKADVTIADFWGIDKVIPEMDDGKGISFVLVRTEKGQQLFDSVYSDVIFKAVSYEDGVKKNPVEYKSVMKPAQRNYFFSDMNSLSFEALVKKYGDPKSVILKRKIKKIIRKITNRK